jgi:3-oxoacyl-[acyl-carrier-protein] synthase II
MRRVVVTGIGAVSPLGASFRESWEAIKSASSGIGPISRFDARDLACRVAGEVRGFDPGRFLPKKDVARLDLFVHYAFAAARMAVEDAGLGSEGLKRAGLIIGSSRGGIGMVEAALAKRPSAYVMSGSTVSMAASYTAQRLGVRGRTLGISNACASGANAVGEGMGLIRHGVCDVVLAGGAEAPVTRFCLKGYGVSGALSKAGVSRPFDRKRDGFVLSEGAAVLVLEALESAGERGARVYGEVAGYGCSADAFHQTAPDRRGQAAAIRAVLEDAGLFPKDVDYVSAHATSTPLGDRVEAEAIRTVFEGARPPAKERARPPMVGAVKSMTGHLLGASGALEAAFALMGLKEGFLPHVANLQEPEFSLDYVTEPGRANLETVISNSFGFGGVNAVLLFRRFL